MEKLNRDKVLEKTDELVELIRSNYTYQRYIAISKKMKENKEIMDLISKVKTLEKKIVNLEYYGKNFKTEEKELNDTLLLLDSIPIYKEYSYLVEDLNNTFYGIRELLEIYLDKIIN